MSETDIAIAVCALVILVGSWLISWLMRRRLIVQRNKELQIIKDHERRQEVSEAYDRITQSLMPAAMNWYEGLSLSIKAALRAEDTIEEVQSCLAFLTNIQAILTERKPVIIREVIDLPDSRSELERKIRGMLGRELNVQCQFFSNGMAQRETGRRHRGYTDGVPAINKKYGTDSPYGPTGLRTRLLNSNV